MTSYTFTPPAETLIPVTGSAAQFPVRRIYCVGRNYAEHAREMGADPLYLLTNRKCAAAIHLYEKLGFVRAGAIRVLRLVLDALESGSPDLT